MRQRFSSTFFEQLPVGASIFIIKHAAKLPKAKQGNARTTACAITQVFSDKSYGWEEAILQRCWFRYPHEVQKQRYCGEEAFKNYALGKAVGLQLQYISTRNFAGRGLAHDVVLAQDGRGQVMMDWEKTANVSLEGTILKNEHGKILANDAIIIPEQQIIPRLKRFREGKNIRSALKRGIFLSRTLTDTGELDLYAHISPAKNNLVFEGIVHLFTSELPWYFSRSFNEKNECVDEYGIAAQRAGATYVKIPLMRQKDNEQQMQRFFGRLDESQRTDLFLTLLYHHFIGASGDEFLFSSAERAEGSKKIAQTPHGELYSGLQRESCGQGAEHYLDALIFKSRFARAHQKDLYTTCYKHTKLSIPLGIGMGYTALQKKAFSRFSLDSRIARMHSIVSEHM